MARELGLKLRGAREVAIICASAVGILAFVYLTPPIAGAEVYSWLRPIVELDGDLPQYLWRFLVSAVCLGIFPATVAAAAGERASGIGLARPRRVLPVWGWLIVALVSLGVAIGGAYSPGTFGYYPYSRTLVSRIETGGPLVFVLHALLYLLLFYLPWELLFRGILVFPLLRLASAAPAGGLLALASLQAVPSALLHIGHPAVESFGAIAFGVAAGALSLHTGSIFPSLALHAGIGIAQDLLIVLRLLGALP